MIEHITPLNVVILVAVAAIAFEVGYRMGFSDAQIADDILRDLVRGSWRKAKRKDQDDGTN